MSGDTGERRQSQNRFRQRFDPNRLCSIHFGSFKLKITGVSEVLISFVPFCSKRSETYLPIYQADEISHFEASLFLSFFYLDAAKGMR